jgi:DNA-binding transcriptional ArsR family regulator
MQISVMGLLIQSAYCFYINYPKPNVSRHLKILRERGLVFSKRDGQFVYYHLADVRIIKALDLMRAVMADTLTERARIASENS